MKKIGLCSDHAGYELKEHVKDYLKNEGLEFEDFGTFSTQSCDYPDFAHKLGQAIQSGECERGIAICGSGNGISMTLNKYPKVRAALCWKAELAELARQHNDANILSLPARFTTIAEADAMLNVFLNTAFEGGRHQARVDKIAQTGL